MTMIVDSLIHVEKLREQGLRHVFLGIQDQGFSFVQSEYLYLHRSHVQESSSF